MRFLRQPRLRSLIASTTVILGVASLAVASAALAGSIPARASVPSLALPPLTLSLQLSGNGQTGTSLTVHVNDPVTGIATLSGDGAATAFGTITYNLFSDAACSGTPYTNGPFSVFDGNVPQSDPLGFGAVTTYYWQAVFTDSVSGSTLTTGCGPGNVVENIVAPALTTTVTGAALTGGGSTGQAVTVVPGTPVRESAKLIGTNAATAGGTVSYNVYSDVACTTLVYSTSSAQTVTNGVLPTSPPVTFTKEGKYYWQAVYSGDIANSPSKSTCGEEVETIAAPPPVPELTLSGGGTTGAAITVPVNTPVTGVGELTGASAATASGAVRYSVHTGTCSTANTWVFLGRDQTVTAGVVPPSPPLTFGTAGKYYWQMEYSADGHLWYQIRGCVVETVTAPVTTTLGTSLSGGDAAGVTISVPPGTAVTDAVTYFGGVNVAHATGTLTYTIYSDKACSTKVADGGTVTVADGVIPVSSPVKLTRPGTYYWQAAYSGDSLNAPAQSACGNGVETVQPPRKPRIEAIDSGQGTSSAAAVISTAHSGDLIVAFVSGKGPAHGRQAFAVSGDGLTWHLAGRDNNPRGDSEVWWAMAPAKLANERVHATARTKGWTATLTVVAFRNASGIGNVTKSDATSGAPSGSLTTSAAGSWVFAVGADWSEPVSRVPAAGQVIVHEVTTRDGTFWVQRAGSVTASAGTTVKISDTKPVKDPYNLVLAEIL